MNRRLVGGFTLIELLVVIAIIATLAAILFPVFAQAREAARALVCLSNAKQIGTAAYIYAQDYSEQIVPATNYAADPPVIWSVVLQPYIRNQQIFICPSASNARYSADWSTRSYGTIGYNGNTAYDPTGTEAPKTTMRLTDMDDSARSVLLADTPGGPLADKYRGYVFDPDNGTQNVRDFRLSTPLAADRDLVKELGSSRTAAKLKPVYCRHHADGNNHGKSNLVLADSHAKAFTAAWILGQDAGANLIWKFR